MKKEYQKPELKAIEINADQTILTGSVGVQLYSDEPEEGYDGPWD